MNKNLIWIVVAVIILIGGIWYFNRGTAPVVDNTNTQASSIAGCYVSHLVKDVYILNITAQTGSNVNGTLAFKNFEKDSSSGTFVGTYTDGILVGDYSFQSEGMNSVMQVIFKKSGDTFIRGYGDMNATGDRFADVNNITFDPNQTFVASATCS